MKKILSVLLCAFFVVVMSGCSKENEQPKVVSEKFLDAYAKKDEINIRKYSQWKEYSVKALSIQKSDYIEGVDKKLQKEVYEMMQSFKYKVGKETIKDDHATVNVTLTIYDFDGVIQQGIQEASKKAEEISDQSKIIDTQAHAEINTIIFENMKNAKQYKKETITLNLVKKDGEWLVSNDNVDIQNLLITNMRSLQNIEN